MKRILLAVALLLSMAGVQAADTYLNTACTFNGTGAVGTCAASGGAAGAFNTGASIFWSSIGAGNHLYIAKGTTTSNWAGIIVDTGVIIDAYVGNAAGTDNTACPIWTAPTGTFMMSVSGANVQVNNICVTGNASSALISTAAASTAINNVKVYNNSGVGIGIRFNTSSSNGSATDVEVYGIWDDGIGIANGATGTVTLTRINCHDVDLSGSTGDCVQAYTGTAANVSIVGGTFVKEIGHGVKQAIIYDGSGNFAMSGQPRFEINSGGASVAVWGTATVDITSMYCRSTGGASCLFLTNTGTTNVRNAILIGGDYGIWSSHASGTTTVYNSTILGSKIAGVYNTTGGTFTIKNSYIDGPVTIWNATSAATTVADYNRYGRSSWYWNALPKETYAAWTASVAGDTHSTVKQEVFTSKSDLNSLRLNGDLVPSDFQMPIGSSLKNAGVNVGTFTDFAGVRNFDSTPSIGAFENKFWYVRSASECPNNGNGIASTCATTPGGNGAWNSSANANVLWGSGSLSMNAGDTLFICGSITDFMVIPTISGKSGVRWKISGACPGFSGRGYLQGGPTYNFGIDIETNKSYYTIEDLKLGWAKRDSLYMGVVDGGGANATDVTIQRIEADNTLATTVTNVCHTIYLNKVPGGLYTMNNFLMQDIVVTGTGPVCASSNNDGINLEALGTGAVIRRIEVKNSHEGLDVSGGTGAKFYQIYAHDNLYSGIKFHGIMACNIGLKAYGLVAANNAVSGIIWQDAINSYLMNATIKHAGTLHGLDIESVNTSGGTCVTGNNTYANLDISADYANGAARIYNTTKANFESGNVWNGNNLRQVGVQTTLLYWTSDTGSNITISNWAANWQVNHPKDLQQTAPSWVDGTSPKRVEGFKLGTGSLLKGAGACPIAGCALPDYYGYRVRIPPDIGAFQRQ